MADDGKTTERLEIVLEYESLLSSLKKVSDSYHDMVKRISNVGSDITKNISNIHKEVVRVTSGVSSDLSKTILGDFNTLKKGLTSAHADIRKIQGQISQDLSKIDSLNIDKAKARLKYKKEVENINFALGEGIYGKPGSEKAQTLASFDIFKAKKAYIKEFGEIENQIKKTTNELYNESSKASLKTISAITNTVQKSSELIKTSSSSAIKELDKMAVFSSNLKEKVYQIFNAQQNFSIIQKDFNDRKRFLDSLYKQELEAKKELELAKVAMDKQTDGQLRLLAEKRYRDSVEKVAQITKLQNEARGFAESLGTRSINVGNLIKGARTESIKELQSVFEDVANNASSRMKTSSTILDQIIGKLSEVKEIGRSSTGTLIESVVTYNKHLTQDIQKMDKFISLLKMMKVDQSVIDDFKRLRNEVVATTKDTKEVLGTISNLSSNTMFQNIRDGFRETKKGFLKTYADMYKDIKVYNKAQPDLKTIPGISQSYEFYKTINEQSGQMVRLIAKTENEISKLKIQHSRINAEAVIEENAKNKEALMAYASAVRTQYESMEKHLKSFKEKQSSLGFTGKGVREKLEESAFGYMATSRDKSKELNVADKLLHDTQILNKELISMSNRYGQTNQQNAERVNRSIQENLKMFRRNRDEIEETVKSLQYLQSKNLISAEPAIAELQKVLKVYKDAHGQMSTIASGTAIRMDKISANSSKSFLNSAWEYIRNFRWQIAAVYYLVTKFVMFVKNSFLDVMQQTSKFRMDIFAYAGVVGLNMGKEFAKNYDIIYNYSRDLIERLQTKASESYATLEDLTMVTRSFASHGIFPKTDEDIENVNTLATAVKVLTEGMSNAGVQMRQEIMAMIEGRTRVTDTVARMLKTTVGDLEKKMQDWAIQGKSRLEGFAELLQPFAEVNKHISNEYLVQVNRLKTMWDYLKRMSTEALSLTIGKEIKEFVDSFGVPGKKLTEKGENAVATLRTYFVVLYEYVKMTGANLAIVFEGITNIAVSFGSVFNLTTETSKVTTNWAKGLEVVLKVFEMTKLVIKSIVLSFTTIGNFVGGLMDYMSAAGTTMAGIVTLNTDLINRGIQEANQAQSKWMKPFQDYRNIVVEFDKGMKDAVVKAVDLEKSIKRTANTHEDILDNLLKQTSLNAQISGYEERMNEIQKKYKPKEEKAEDDKKTVQEQTKALIEAINIQNRAIDEQIKNLKEELTKTSEQSKTDMTTVVNTVGENIQTVSSDVEKSVWLNVERAKKVWSDFIDGMKFWKQWFGEEASSVVSNVQVSIPRPTSVFEALPDPVKMSEQNEDRRLKELHSPYRTILRLEEQRKNNNEQINKAKQKESEIISDINSKLAKSGGHQKTVIDYTKQYYDLLEKLGGLDPFKKIWLEYQSNMADIAKEAQDNSLVAEQRKQLEDLANARYWDEIKTLNQEVTDSIEDLNRTMLGKELNAFERIDEEFKNHARKIDDLIQQYKILGFVTQEESEKIKDKLKKNLEIGKIAADNKEQIKQLKMVSDTYTDVMDAQSELLSLSLNYKDQQKANLLELEAEWKRYNDTVIKALTDQKEIMSDDNFQKYQSAMLEEAEIRWKIHNEKLLEIQHPFWGEMKNMANQATDDISNMIAGMFDPEKKKGSWKEDLAKALGEIRNNVISNLFKQNVVGPLMGNMMGGIQSLFFGKGKEFDKTNFLSGLSQQGMPVHVTNFRELGISSGANGITGALTKQGTNALSSVIPGESINPAFAGPPAPTASSGMFGWIKDLFSGGGILSGIKDIFSKMFGGIFDLIKGLFSGFGGGGSLFGGGGFLSGLFGGITKLFGFAEGGVIEEPVIGRGLRSGAAYTFGEKGEKEWVTPESKMRSGKGNQLVQHISNVQNHYHINAIEPQTFESFLVKHGDRVSNIVAQDYRKNGVTRQSMRG